MIPPDDNPAPVRHFLGGQIVDRQFDLLRPVKIKTDRGSRVEGVGVVLGQCKGLGRALAAGLENGGCGRRVLRHQSHIIDVEGTVQIADQADQFDSPRQRQSVYGNFHDLPILDVKIHARMVTVPQHADRTAPVQDEVSLM